MKAGLLAFAFLALSIGANLLARFAPDLVGFTMWLYWAVVIGAYACLFVALFWLAKQLDRARNDKKPGRKD